MKLPPIASALPPPAGISNSAGPKGAGKARADGKVVDAAQQFEGILLRQILSEAMKPLLQEGPGAQVYGYLVTDSLAGSMSKAGGLGLSSMLLKEFTRGPHR